jgi:hypothetical protein
MAKTVGGGKFAAPQITTYMRSKKYTELDGIDINIWYDQLEYYIFSGVLTKDEADLIIERVCRQKKQYYDPTRRSPKSFIKLKVLNLLGEKHSDKMQKSNNGMNRMIDKYGDDYPLNNDEAFGYLQHDQYEGEEVMFKRKKSFEKKKEEELMMLPFDDDKRFRVEYFNEKGEKINETFIKEKDLIAQKQIKVNFLYPTKNTYQIRPERLHYDLSCFEKYTTKYIIETYSEYFRDSEIQVLNYLNNDVNFQAKNGNCKEGGVPYLIRKIKRIIYFLENNEKE